MEMALHASVSIAVAMGMLQSYLLCFGSFYV